MPFVAMSPSLKEDVRVDGLYPQMSMRLQCDRKHDATYESVRNSGKKTGLVDERNGVKKGGPTCMVLPLACCRH